MQGYKRLLSYQLARIIFDLTWEFVPEFYFKIIEDSRQDVARSSLGELLEDYEDIQSYLIGARITCVW